MLKDHNYTFSKIYINDRNAFTKILIMLFLTLKTIGAFFSYFYFSMFFEIPKHLFSSFQIYKINGKKGN